MTTITWNGENLLVRADGRAGMSIKAFTPERFYALSPDVDLHETAALAISRKGEPVQVLGHTRVVRPRNATVHSVCM